MTVKCARCLRAFDSDADLDEHECPSDEADQEEGGLPFEPDDDWEVPDAFRAEKEAHPMAPASTQALTISDSESGDNQDLTTDP